MQKGNRREEVIEAKPNPKKFKIVFRGYDIDEVDEFAEKYALADEVMADRRSVYSGLWTKIKNSRKNWQK